MVENIYQNGNDFWTVVFRVNGRQILAEVETEAEAMELRNFFFPSKKTSLS